MTDEKYDYIQGIRDKKAAARGAYHKRTHCGKGGSVRFTTDNLTKKEWEKLNGETKTYRMNEPISWKEFKAMPDDLKVQYIKGLWDKFKVSNTYIAEMLGVTVNTLWVTLKRIGCMRGTGSNYNFDKAAWYAWVNGDQTATEAVEETAAEAVEETVAETPAIECEEPNKPPCNLPVRGVVEYECAATVALAKVADMLGMANAKICISWELV